MKLNPINTPMNIFLISKPYPNIRAISIFPLKYRSRNLDKVRDAMFDNSIACEFVMAKEVPTALFRDSVSWMSILHVGEFSWILSASEWLNVWLALQ